MTLPNYFLADLPPEASLTGAMVREACQTLKRNREQYLATHTTSHLIKVLSDTAANWLAEDFPLRRMALEQGPAATGFSSATLAKGLDAFFRQLTRENLHALVLQDPFNMGYLAVRTMAQKLRGEPVERRIDTGAKLVTAENMDQPAIKELLEPDLKKWLGE